MAEKKASPNPIVYPAVQIKYKGLFEFKDLYGIMFSWLKDNGWVDKNTGGDAEYCEEFFLEKTGPTGAKDHIIYWELEKFASDYFKYSMSVSINTTFLNKTEIMHEGQKVNTNVGEVGIKIQAKLFPDYKAEWTNHWLLGPFHKKLSDTMLGPEFGTHKTKLYKQLYGFQAEIKRYLKLNQFMPTGDEFIPDKSV